MLINFIVIPYLNIIFVQLVGTYDTIIIHSEFEFYVLFVL